MVVFKPVFNIALGSSENSSVYIQDGNGDWQEFINYEFFRIMKRMNQISEFELRLYDIQDAEKVYVKEFAEIMFFSENTLILKGRIQKISYETSFSTIATGYGKEAILLDKELVQDDNTSATWQESKRGQWTNVSAQTIAKEILSSNTDGSSPWIMQPNTTELFDTDYGNISIRFEYANRLNALAKVSEAINYEWSVTQDASFNDYFNIGSLLPDNTSATVSQETFAITGSDANVTVTNKEKDISNLANKIDILGRGDGINQLRSSVYNASTTFSTLSSDITNTDTTISLTDASSFPNSGTIRIMEEQVIYSGKSGNNLTGCTRGSNGTTGYSHKKSIFVEKHIAIASAESGSSIGDNGLMDITLTQRDIIDRDTLELIASREILDRKDPILRIIVIPNEPLTIAGSRNIGELITITDAESDISDDYRIVSMTYTSNYGVLGMEIEASNRSLSFIEQMKKQQEETSNMSKYMQGATNIYALTETSEGDATNPVNVRFFIPNEAVAINKVLLNFNMKPIKTFQNISDSGIDSNFSASNLSSTYTDNIGSVSVTTKAGDSVLVFFNCMLETVDDSETMNIKIRRDTTDLTSAPSMYSTVVGDNFGIWQLPNSANYLDSPGAGTFSYNVSAKSSNDTGDLIGGYLTVMVFSGGFRDGTLTGESVLVKAGPDGGALTTVDTYTSDQTEIDITSIIQSVGAGNWAQIEFTPNQDMRIEANAYVQIFLESKIQ